MSNDIFGTLIRVKKQTMNDKLSQMLEAARKKRGEIVEEVSQIQETAAANTRRMTKKINQMKEIKGIDESDIESISEKLSSITSDFGEDSLSDEERGGGRSGMASLSPSPDEKKRHTASHLKHQYTIKGDPKIAKNEK